MNSKLLTSDPQGTRYTLAEAERMLPLIQAIAAELVERIRIRASLQRQRRELEAAKTPEGTAAALGDLDAVIFEHHDGIRRSVDELVELGMTVLRLNPLTVHIPGRSIGGPLVFCWQVGDRGIDHGHRVGEEDDQRRPLKVRTPKGIA